MANTFSTKNAKLKMSDGSCVKMISTDFKQHIFYINQGKNRTTQPVSYCVKGNASKRYITRFMTWDEFDKKFGNKEFVEFNEAF